MHKLTNWTAKRAGGRITVYGKDEQGADAKLVGIDRVERFQPDNGTARMTIAVRDHVSPTEWFELAD